MHLLGAKAGIAFDFDVEFAWHPVDAQRVLIWAQQWGKSEEFAEELARLHFEQGKGSCLRSTVLEAAERAGMRRETVVEFLEGGELEEHVWGSYTDMVETHRIDSIPLFVFTRPTGSGGYFRRSDAARGSEVWIVRGSASKEQFVGVLEGICGETEQAGGL